MMIKIDILHNDIIRLQKNKDLPNIYDIEMQQLDELAQYDSVECHIVLYPYSRKICSKDIKFYPFEEYVKDILSHQKSAYAKSSSQFNKIFGLLLGLLITIIFFKFKPDDLFSVESIVSVFGAYFVGKEVWDDIEKNLINLSKNWKLRYQEDYYFYRLEKYTTLTLYSNFAKKQRYGKTPLLPGKIDFIEQSNSQTLRMYFNIQDFQDFCSCNGRSSGHLFSIHVEPELLVDFEQEGFMLGVKLSLNKHVLGFTKRIELFQSLHKNSQGALDEHGIWSEGSVFYRKTVTFGRLKAFLQSAVIHQKTIIG